MAVEHHMRSVHLHIIHFTLQPIIGSGKYKSKFTLRLSDAHFPKQA